MINRAESIVIMPVEAIIPNPKNPNKHPEKQILKLVEIIKYQGFRNPLVISNRTGFLVSGHGRLEAAKRLELKELPCVFQTFESEAQEYAYIVSDNAVQDMSVLDLGQINKEIIDLGPELDIDMLAIENFSLVPGELDEEEDDKLQDDENKKFIIEVTFPNEMEMRDIYDDLIHRGYTARIK